MELLQSQAPVDKELSGSSSSARHMGLLTLNITYQTLDIGIWKYWREVIFRGDKIRLKHFPKIGIFSKYLNDLMIMSLVWLFIENLHQQREFWLWFISGNQGLIYHMHYWIYSSDTLYDSLYNSNCRINTESRIDILITELNLSSICKSHF